MATKGKAVQKPKPSENPNNRSGYALAIGVIAIAAVFVVLFYLLLARPQTGFGSFQKSFDAANTVGIYENFSNSTTFAGVISCGDSILQELTFPGPAHRNPESIRLFVLYNDSCSMTVNPGVLSHNTTIVSRQQCVDYSGSNPSIYVAYSQTNQTIIQPTRLYFIGEANFLDECAIATQISAASP